MFLYYPGHRQVPAPLRALIDMIRVPSTTSERKRPALANPFAACALQGCELAAEDHASRAGGAKPYDSAQPSGRARSSESLAGSRLT
jgi:hypothetical protein